MDMLNKNLHKAILGTQKSDGELMLESISVEKFGDEINSSKLIGINIASEVNKVIPGFIAAGSAYRAKDIINSTDVYKIVLKDGFSQDSVKRFLTNKDQKMITTYLDVNGKFNQAGLEKVNSELAKPMNSVAFATAFAGVMQILSIAVGEYYRCEINSKLETIQNEIKDIKQFLIDDKSSFVSGAIETFNKYMLDMSDMSVMLNSGLKQSYANEVQNIISKSRALKDFAQARINEIIDQLNSSVKIKKESISDISDNIKLYLSWYEDSVKLIIYGESIFARLIDSNVSLKNSINEVEKSINTWKDINISIQSALNGKEIKGLGIKQEKIELTTLASFINKNLNENKLAEESQLLVASNVMYFKQAELYYQDGKMYIPKYEYIESL